jgi:hypothetical protein
VPGTAVRPGGQAAAASRLRAAGWSAIASGVGGIAGVVPVWSLFLGQSLLRAARSPAPVPGAARPVPDAARPRA